MRSDVPARPEPVLDAANLAGNISGIVGGLATVLTAYAAISHQEWAVAAAAFLAAVGAGLAKVLPRATAIGARAQVTPLSEPLSADGHPLAPTQL